MDFKAHSLCRIKNFYQPFYIHERIYSIYKVYDLSCNTYTPVEVEMCKFVCEPLELIRVKSNIITDHIV